jgi:hypothetical protein
MKSSWYWLAIGAILSLAGCFSVDISEVTIKCDDAHPECPDGEVCIANLCQPAPSPLSDMAVGTADLAVIADLAVGKPCAFATETPVGDAYACAGIFGPGVAMTRASALCGAGYSICTAVAQLNDTADKCAALVGFFAVNVPASRNAEGPLDSKCNTAGINRQWYGCGGVGTVALSRSTTYPTAMCSGFKRALDCSLDKKWLCQSSLEDTTNTLPGDGVMCCRTP